MELLREKVLKASRHAVLVNPRNAVHVERMDQLRTAATRFGLALHWLEARAARDLDRAFEAAGRERADVLVVLRDPIVVLHRKWVVELAAERHHRLSIGYADQCLSIIAGGEQP